MRTTAVNARVPEDGGAVPTRAPAFRRHLRAEVRAGKGAYLFSEQGVIAMRGAKIESLAALLDGTHDLDGLLRDRPGGMAPEEVAALLAQLVDAGLVTLRSQGEDDRAGDERALAYWDACGVDADLVAARQGTVRLTAVGDSADGVDPGAVERALAGAGLGVVRADAGAADLSVVLCADYLDPRLAEVDAEHRRAGRPWLLARPFGAQVWIGPVLQPEGACWHCLTHRLWGHRHAEACVQEELGHAGPARRPMPALPPLTSAAAHLVALEAAKWVAGYRYHGQQCVWTLDTLDLQGRLHELRRRPQCPGCGDPWQVAWRSVRPVTLQPAKKATTGGGGHRTATPSQMLERHRHLISPITGIIKEIQPDPAAPPFANAYRSGPNVARGITGMAALRAGLRCENGGKGVSPLDAEVSALCEAAERFSGNFQGDELRIRGSYDELEDEAVHPNACMLFAGRQYADREAWNRAHADFQHVPEPFDTSARTDWTPVWSPSGRRRLLPTSYLYYGTPRVSAARGVRADSNGAAAGSSLEDAILQGALELVERDAVALWWYNRTPVPGVDLASFADAWLEEMAGNYVAIGRELWVLDVTSDLGIPVAVALSRRTDGPHEDIMMGFGAHLDPRIAVRRAVTELNQMLPVVREGGRGLDDPDARRWLAYATVANQPYLRPAAGQRMRTAADFPFVNRPDVRDDVEALGKVFDRAGLELLVLDQTRPDVGIPVVKVLVPGLRPFWARFAPGRLFDVPVALGRLEAPTPYERLNPFPMFL
ncbi:TOMM precursor leader peptide-binding protein [Amycolatopsis sp. FBCC-B4732]|uniref:TOMM precursor leader peptide-binding protein n=1 Tax=unclassified Amycolatopsis TaxID=2618356 RepID=UPI001FF5AB30|nr:TOMM precursor leader peptide-binding protein [Amycolatopsis sp. FBCC-B4732]UOX89457.1 TOMM precursor leader peptide-binding protein [Amycolatopsis sp. FBCC-B4732]